MGLQVYMHLCVAVYEANQFYVVRGLYVAVWGRTGQVGGMHLHRPGAQHNTLYRHINACSMMLTTCL